MLTIQVLNVDNSTASPSVLLFTDKERYLFNAGEGIQRHFLEYRLKINKVAVAAAAASAAAAAAAAVWTN